MNSRIRNKSNSSIFISVVALLIFSVLVSAAAAHTINTTRIYSDYNAGAGAWVPGEDVANRLNDTVNDDIPAEQQPYTDVYSIFTSQGNQSPRKDSITFNPVYISENPTDDASELQASGLARNIKVDSRNGNEKVFFRQWYQPDYLDKDTDTSGWVTARISPGKDDELETAPLNGSDDVIKTVNGKEYIYPGDDGVLESIPGDEDGDGAIDVPDTDDFYQEVPSNAPDEHYPAILQEFTYMFTKAGALSSETVPVSVEPGTGSAFVFPVGIREGLFWDSFGHGLTSLDPTMDGKDNPTVVEVHSEQSLADATKINADFNGNGQLDTIDNDSVQLSGDELVILSPPTILDVPVGNMSASVTDAVQFLDHAVVVKEVFTSPKSVKVGIYYTGDTEPKFIGDAIISEEDMILVGTKPQFTYIHSGEQNIGLPKGAFFIYIDKINTTGGTADIKIGRALGAAHSAMEQSPNTPDQSISDPWWLKRFYVDGHEYNVVALYSDPLDSTRFKFITIRTPIPKEGIDLDPVILIEQHSVRLSPYEKNRPLSVMPPYNYEHTELTDIQEWDTDIVDRFFRGIGDNTSTVEQPGFFVGTPYTAKPIFCEAARYVTLDGRRIDIETKDLMFYVDEAKEPQLKGEFKEKYNENNMNSEEWWYVEQFNSKPDRFTEFYLPVGHGLYLITLNYIAPEMNEGGVTYLPRGYRENPDDAIADGGILPTGGRVKFWFDPTEGGKKFKDENGIRLYGASFNEFDEILTDWSEELFKYGPSSHISDPIKYNEALNALSNLTPRFLLKSDETIEPSELVRAGDTTVADPKTGALVEDAPYTDHISIFNPQGYQAYPKSILTVDPAWLDEFTSADELKDMGLYAKIAIDGNDAREKVFARMWYEPFHFDKDIDSSGDFGRSDDWYPAIMQEFTYMLVGVNSQPASGLPGETMFAFPIGTKGDELDAGNPKFGGTPGDDGLWGYGLTTFDPLPYDGKDEADTVTIHSEQTLHDLTNISIDFNGDSELNSLDDDHTQFSGDEMIIPTLILNLKNGDKAQFLDHMIRIDSVSDAPEKVDLTVYNVGALDGMPDIIGTAALHTGEAVTVNLESVNSVIPAGGSNLLKSMDKKGPWFVYVSAINAKTGNVAVVIGRALGATHSAMEYNGAPDITPGDPWWLKRFYVDGHEYNVVAIKTETPVDDGAASFKFITIRTPVQKVYKEIDQHSFACQDYSYTKQDQISVLPPFNYEHTARTDIQDGWLPPRVLEDPLGYMGPVEKHKGALDITIVDEDIDHQFLGDIKEIYTEVNTTEYSIYNMSESWSTGTFWTAPFRYTELRINQPEEKYLLKLDWLAPQGLFQVVNFNNDNDVMLAPEGLIQPKVKFWYDPEDTNDLYINERTLGSANVKGKVDDVVGKSEGLGGATVTIQNGTWNATTHSVSDGSYDLGAVYPGEYTVTASLSGYTQETILLTVKQSGIEIVDFTYEHGLVPEDPTTNYVLRAIRLWYDNKISLNKVLSVISAWST